MGLEKQEQKQKQELLLKLLMRKATNLFMLLDLKKVTLVLKFLTPKSPIPL